MPKASLTNTATVKVPRSRKPLNSSKMLKAMKVQKSRLAVAFRHIKPSWRNYIDYVEQAVRNGDKELGPFMAAWAGITNRERSTITPEQLCDLSHVSEAVLFGAVCSQLWSNGHQEANIITAIAYPKVIERTAKNAVTSKGGHDREMFHKATGFLKTPNGPSITINNSPQTALISGSAPIRALPSMEDSILAFEDVQAITIEPLQLTSGDR